ncbi:MAG: hypothetical protein H6923_04505 [Alphaproteobacteria bacterium]|nr:hypothetical protein [Alphaproteobacteria bacterium]
MRLAFLFLVLVAVGVVALAVIQPVIELTPVEAVREEVREVTTGDQIGTRIVGALARNDYDEALMYRDIARDASLTLPPDATDALERAGTFGATAARAGSQVVVGFLTGEAESLAGMTGAVVSDLTVVGDIRDIAQEGSKLVQNEPYNELVLGLSVIGVAATGATIATGGATLPGRVGVTILKVASKANTLTVEFARTLTRLVGNAVELADLKQLLRTTKITDSAATRDAIAAYAKSLKGTELVPVLARIDDVQKNVGAVETVRLMRYVKSTDDLDDIAEMSKSLGKNTRGVIEITGKTSLRAFKTSMNVFSWVIGHIFSFLAWVGTFFLSLLGAGRVFGAIRPKA